MGKPISDGEQIVTMNLQTRSIIMSIFLLLWWSCSGDNKNNISEVRVSFTGLNVLHAQVEVQTNDAGDVFIKYGEAGQKEKPFISQKSTGNTKHSFALTSLKPGQEYVFTIIASGGISTEVLGDYFFKTVNYEAAIKNTFEVSCSDTSALPYVFKQGYIMLNQREIPGSIFLLNSKGNVMWFHQAKDAGFKVIHFTNRQTFLCLLGTREYQTSYGSAILELSLTGDTLLYLRKGQNDFQQTIHHEIVLNSKNEIVTLCVEDKIFDLRSRGGLAKDTVRGDGIVVLDRQGHQKWKWTVFDEVDPLKDGEILKNKKDWMHANSLAFDKDGNYLISFYNNGQIWKIDAATGKVVWKFGKNGDFEMPSGAIFPQAHAVHINSHGWLHFFDNGTINKLSRSMAFVLDETEKKAEQVIDCLLPPQLFSDRMGSSYLVGDTTLLQCASKQKTLLLTNFRGHILWQLRSSGIMSYRAEFIPANNVNFNMLYTTKNKNN